MEQKILVADDEEGVRKMIRRALAPYPYQVLSAKDGVEAVDIATKSEPSLIILDVEMPGKNGWAVLKDLRSKLQCRMIPVIMLTGRGTLIDKVAGLSMGADDFITKPFLIEELIARIEALLRRARRDLGANPLTHLPGSPAIAEEVARRLSAGKPFAISYADIDRFKSFNDTYGYARGDQVILDTADILLECVRAMGDPDDLVAHVGGDDFVVISRDETSEKIAAEAVRRFDRDVASHYDLADAARGYVVTCDRQGDERRFALLSLSIGIATNEKNELGNYDKAVEIATGIKQYLKSLTGRRGSSFLKNNRNGKNQIPPARSRRQNKNGNQSR